ncbi:unnamed protein product, partial [Scytosiphon promiscuus]
WKETRGQEPDIDGGPPRGEGHRFMNHDIAFGGSVRENSSGSSSSDGAGEDINFSITSSVESNGMKQESAPSTTVPQEVPPDEDLRSAPSGAASAHTVTQDGPQVSITLLDSNDGGGEVAAPMQAEAPPAEHLIFPAQFGTCHAGGAGDDRSQSEATTGSVSPPRTAHFSCARTPRASGGGTSSSPATAGEDPCIFQTSAHQGKAIDSMPSPGSSTSRSIPLRHGEHLPGTGAGSPGACKAVVPAGSFDGVDVERAEVDGRTDAAAAAEEDVASSQTQEEPACGVGSEGGRACLPSTQQENEDEQHVLQEQGHGGQEERADSAKRLSLKEDNNHVNIFSDRAVPMTTTPTMTMAMKGDNGAPPPSHPPLQVSPSPPPYLPQQTHQVQHGSQLSRPEGFEGMTHGSHGWAQPNDGRFVNETHHHDQFHH